MFWCHSDDISLFCLHTASVRNLLSLNPNHLKSSFFPLFLSRVNFFISTKSPSWGFVHRGRCFSFVRECVAAIRLFAATLFSFDGPRKKSTSVRPILKFHFFAMVGMDFLGPISLYCQMTRYRYVLIMVDYFNRFVWAKECKTVIQKVVYLYWITELTSIFEFPRYLYNDNESHFTEDEITALFISHGTVQIAAPISHPSSVGLVERNHSSDSTEVPASMTSTEEAPDTEGQMTEATTKEAYDTGETLSWWVIAPKEQRDPMLPDSPLTDTQLYFVVHTRLSGKERHDRYPKEFDMTWVKVVLSRSLLAFCLELVLFFLVLICKGTRSHYRFFSPQSPRIHWYCVDLIGSWRKSDRILRWRRQLVNDWFFCNVVLKWWFLLVITSRPTIFGFLLQL